MAEAIEQLKEEKEEPVHNKSTIFIRSMLGFSPLFYGNAYYYNTYVSVNPDRMYIVFHKLSKDADEDEINRYMKQYPYIFNTLREHPCFVEQIGTELYDIFVFDIPNKFKEDFILFLEGKYSKMSPHYKEELLALHSPMIGAFNRIKAILYPQKHHRAYLEKKLDVVLPSDAEIFDRIEFSEEMFDINKFK